VRKADPNVWTQQPANLERCTVQTLLGRSSFTSFPKEGLRQRIPHFSRSLYSNGMCRSGERGEGLPARHTGRAANFRPKRSARPWNLLSMRHSKRLRKHPRD
jgi:hypothetical protein